MRHWVVAGAIIESDDGLLLVRNLRKNGQSDWTPPGGVIEQHETNICDGLAREVLEETGLTVTEWGSKLYEVEACAPGLGWVMHAEVWYAKAVNNTLCVGNDPDGIVTHAKYIAHHECSEYLESTHDWVSEPLLDWMTNRWTTSRLFRYELVDTPPGVGRIVRLPDADPRSAP